MNFYLLSKASAATCVTSSATADGHFVDSAKLLKHSPILTSCYFAKANLSIVPSERSLSDTDHHCVKHVKFPFMESSGRSFADSKARVNAQHHLKDSAFSFIFEFGFIIRLFFGGIPIDTPQRVSRSVGNTLTRVPPSKRSPKVLYNPDFVQNEINFTAHPFYAPFYRVDLSLISSLAKTRLASAKHYKKSVKFFKNLESCCLSQPKAARVSFAPSPVKQNFITTEPPILVQSLPSSTSTKSALKKSPGPSALPRVEWQEVNFAGFYKLVDKIFAVLENETDSASFNAKLNSLYSVLLREVVSKVKANYTGYGNKLDHLRSSVLSVHGNLRGLHNELECINDEYESGESIILRLCSFKKRLTLASKSFSKSSLHFAIATKEAKKAQALLFEDIVKCQKLCHKVHSCQADVISSLTCNSDALPGAIRFSKQTSFIHQIRPQPVTERFVNLLDDTNFSLNTTEMLLKSLKNVFGQLSWIATLANQVQNPSHV
ncbi:hypothetical_protein [Candidozyma auris]|uniref:hypothetical_protein n=1 Tax=Candidozyma auris TaxID=498019 RepID=UPI000D2EBA78|nr:hypothetical_protein [[Candida] auris]XP_054558232.1 hypothetical_protein [[Candida] auris]QEO23905.1 hypothetical_protein [[Candida] auris]QEO23963.1 hypothetical_protein [[Candida] auris]GBL52806.1 hypothetical protein CAJCM15448_50800 [[Candida] auris]